MLLKHMKTDPLCTFPSITLLLDHGEATEFLRQICKGDLIFMCLAVYESSNLKHCLYGVSPHIILG